MDAKIEQLSEIMQEAKTLVDELAPMLEINLMCDMSPENYRLAGKVIRYQQKVTSEGGKMVAQTKVTALAPPTQEQSREENISRLLDLLKESFSRSHSIALTASCGTPQEKA